jgi:hypothetical protein
VLGFLIIVLISSETMPSLSPDLHWLLWQMCRIFKSLLYFLLPIFTTNTQLKADSNNHATVWMLCCVEISSAKFISPLLCFSFAYFTSLTISAHGQNVDKFFARM